MAIAAERISTKLFIPHPAALDCKIVGILEQLAPGQSTHERKIALILHGTMGSAYFHYLRHRDEMGGIIEPKDSFRFDFRGNHETGGVWKQGALDEDLVDLQAVVDYLKQTYGYVIDLIVGHSRGSIVAFRWISTTEDGRKVSAFVNASGRYRMAKILESPAGTIWQEHFAKQGFYTWNVTVARRNIVAKITPEDLEDFVNWDTSFIWDHFPSTTDVLTLHGLQDKTVPPYDALIYARALSSRSPGTHTLYFMENADHNFTDRRDDVIDAILQWWDVWYRGEAKTGIWVEGIKGKL